MDKNITVPIVKVEQAHLAYQDKAVQHKLVQNVLAQKAWIKAHTQKNLATQKAPALETVKVPHLAALDAANNE